MAVKITVSYETRKSLVSDSETIELAPDRAGHEFGSALTLLNRMLKEAHRQGALEAQSQTGRTISVSITSL